MYLFVFVLGEPAARYFKVRSIDGKAYPLRYSVEATYQDVARGKVPYRGIGGTLVFFEEEIVEFLDKQPGMHMEEFEKPTMPSTE